MGKFIKPHFIAILKKNPNKASYIFGPDLQIIYVECYVSMAEFFVPKLRIVSLKPLRLKTLSTDTLVFSIYKSVLESHKPNTQNMN